MTAPTIDATDTNGLTLDYMIRNLYTLNTVDMSLRAGSINEQTAREYVTLWNATKGRFTEAYIMGGAIRQRDRS